MAQAAEQPPEDSTKSGVVKLRPEQRIRCLYPNPVCFLTSSSPDLRAANVMTISWVTPLSNRGTFLASMNVNRHSGTLVTRTRQFVLNVATHGQEELLKRVGSCSGGPRRGQAGVNKFSTLALRLCRPGWTDVGMTLPETGETQRHKEPHQRAAAAAAVVDPASASASASADVLPDSVQQQHQPVSDEQKAATAAAWPTSIALTDCCAHLCCRVESYSEVDGHFVLLCHLTDAFVRSEYWSGKVFRPEAGAAPFLSFLGSGEFACTVPTAQYRQALAQQTR